jgi:soluble lytic murein transglycosylase-like protein
MRWAAENDYDALIVPRAQAADVEVALVKAIIAHESRFVPTAYHFDGPDPALNASYGLMQVEGRTARDCGFTGDFPTLYDPGTNLDLGIPLLGELLRHYTGDVARAVSAYNGGDRPALGFGTPFPDGTFGNQAYVDDVLEELAYYRSVAQPTAAPSSPKPAGGHVTIPTIVLFVVAVVVVLVVGRILR